jgi:PBP1b-binding outer membrane lipoprotein LpoB
MFCDHTGRPTDDGDYELRDGQIILRNGRTIGARMMFMDGASSKADKPPASIDEALQQTFETMAKSQNTTVAAMLTSMPQAKIEETAAQVATAFISAHAGHGVASQFAKDAAFISDAERNLIVTKARADHETSHAYLASPPPFTDRDGSAAVINAIKRKASNAALSATRASMTADLKAKHDAAYAASKQQLRDAHRG